MESNTRFGYQNDLLLSTKKIMPDKEPSSNIMLQKRDEDREFEIEFSSTERDIPPNNYLKYVIDESSLS